MSIEQISPQISALDHEAFELQEAINNKLDSVTAILRVISDCAHNCGLAEECKQEGLLSGYAISNSLCLVFDELDELGQKADQLWKLPRRRFEEDKLEPSHEQKDELQKLFGILSYKNKRRALHFIELMAQEGEHSRASLVAGKNRLRFCREATGHNRFILAGFGVEVKPAQRASQCYQAA